MNEDYTWQQIASSINELNFSNEGLTKIEIDGKHICISYYKNNLFSFLAKCPHAGGNLDCGYVDSGGNIVCPLHGYKFNLQNGRNITGEGYFLKIFPVQIRSNAVFIAIEKNKSMI